MDYSSYFAAPASAVPAYPFFDLPGKPDHSYTPQDEPRHNPLDAYNDPNAFNFFDQTAHFDPAQITLPPQTPPLVIPRPSISHALPYESSGSNPTDALPDVEFDPNQGGRGGSSDDDKDNLTPAQSRRKAQNRAAQRAFRERKERHVKDLEVKLKSIEARSTDLMTDNERLKRELDRLATQNEILRATAPSARLPPQDPSQDPRASSTSPGPKILTSGPMIYSPSTFNNAFSEHNPAGPDDPISHRIRISAQTGERLFATGAAWELIQSHELYRKGLVDIGEVCDRLKEKVLCDGSGPTFAEGDINKAIEDSLGAAGDELI